MIKKSILIGIIILVFLLIPYFFNEKKPVLRNFQKINLTELPHKEITFKNEQGIQLGGLLFLPKKEKKYPLAIIIHGSGCSSRNNSWYLAIVRHLLLNGIAVLLPDKRGCGKSNGSWVGASIEDLAIDTESAVDFVKSSSLNYSKIGIIGISQGGWIAPVVASRKHGLNFSVNISGSMTNVDEQLEFEEINNISQYTYKFIARFISNFTVPALKKRKTISSLFEFDPLPYWKKVKIPVFIAYGERDLNCPVAGSLAIIKKHHFNNIFAKVYPGCGHGLLNKEKTAIRDDFLNDLDKFILNK